MATASLSGQVIVITGGSRGIGRALTLEAAARGARVVFCARTLGDEGAGVQEEARRLGGPGAVVGVRADISVESDVEALFDAALQAYGRVDVAINNAGISREALLVSLPGEMWDQVIATNLTGAFLVARKAIRVFLAQGNGGAIVSIGSVMQEGAPSNASYAASKSGLIGLTDTIAREYGRYGIFAYLAVVGAVETDLTRAVPEALRRAIVEGCPQKRQGSVAEIVSAVLFLATAGGGLANGQMMRISGGLREVSV